MHGNFPEAETAITQIARFVDSITA